MVWHPDFADLPGAFLRVQIPTAWFQAGIGAGRHASSRLGNLFMLTKHQAVSFSGYLVLSHLGFESVSSVLAIFPQVLSQDDFLSILANTARSMIWRIVNETAEVLHVTNGK